MNRCPKCGKFLYTHTQLTIYDCLKELSDMNKRLYERIEGLELNEWYYKRDNKQLLEVCKLVVGLWGEPPNPMTYNRLEAAIADAEKGNTVLEEIEK